MPAAPTPRRELPAEAAVLAATEGLLAQRRFSELAVNDIIAAAGVSRTSFYAHFASRGAVLAACLRRVVDEIAVAVDPLRTDITAETDPTTAIRTSLRRWVDLAGEHGPLLRTVSEEWPHDPELRDLWCEVMARFTTETARLIQRTRTPGTAPAGAEPEALAACLMWGYERVLHVSLVGGALGLDDLESIAEPLTQMMVGGVFGARTTDADRPGGAA
jgi:AcrR family transcriptional regulator